MDVKNNAASAGDVLQEPAYTTLEPDRFEINTRKKAILVTIGLPATFLLIMVLFVILDPIMSKIMPPCALNALLGLNCLLCGGTRCARALAQFDLATAFWYNPYVMCVAAWVFVRYLILAFSCFRREYKPYTPRISKVEWWILLISGILFFVVRNFPFYSEVLGLFR